jgi:hypothetical protein
VKSYFLSPIPSRDSAVSALSVILPGQADPWLLKDSDGDAMAYFRVEPPESTHGRLMISVDVSGRHYHRDSDIMSILEKLREKLGGDITHAP